MEDANYSIVLNSILQTLNVDTNAIRVFLVTQFLHVI